VGGISYHIQFNNSISDNGNEASQMWPPKYGHERAADSSLVLPQLWKSVSCTFLKEINTVVIQ